MSSIGSYTKRVVCAMSTRAPEAPALLEMRDIRIDGFSDERWHEIIKGIKTFSSAVSSGSRW